MTAATPMTNNQVALMAAATVFSGGRGHTAPADVKGMAQAFNTWLDQQDALTAARVRSSRTEEVGGLKPSVDLTSAVLAPAEEVSHHISCDSRRRLACNCSATPFFPKPTDPRTR